MPTITVAKENARVKKDMSLNDLLALLHNKRITDKTKVKINGWIDEREQEIKKSIPVWMNGFNKKLSRLLTIGKYNLIRQRTRYFIIDKLTSGKRTLEYNLDEYTMGECCSALLGSIHEILIRLSDDAKRVDPNCRTVDEMIDAMYLNIEKLADEEQGI